MATLLWRLDGDVQQVRADSWQQGLTLHLLFQSLTTIVARRDGATRHYLVLNGCPDCRPDGCVRLCHRMLFAQLVRTTLPGVRLTPAPRLPARASEVRQIVAAPRRPDAELLDGAFLVQWTEGLLVSTWSRLRATPQPITVGVRLAVGKDGPDPTRALLAAGWQQRPLATLLSRRAREAPIPPPVEGGTRGSGALFAALCDPQHLVAQALLATGKV